MRVPEYTLEQFNTDLEQPYAWPGGYPRYFLMSDGETLSFASAKKNVELIRAALIDGDKTGGWLPVACDINWEDAEMYCAHSGERIESAYAES